MSAVASALAPVLGSVAAVVDPALASRVQFAWSISVHIVFAALSVGLAPYIVYFTYKEVRTGEERFARLRGFWTKVFALGFVLGTVTGIPLSFQFGTNFAAFSTFAGEVIGGPLAFETFMAFFLEAVFLGILLFGRDRVSDRLYVGSSVLVMAGAWASAFWILVVNAWMQTPRGYELVERGGETLVRLTDPVAAFTTPRLPWLYVHMTNAAVVSVSLLIAGVAAYFVWANEESEPWAHALRVSVAVLAVAGVFQVIHGDAYTRHVVQTQPMKFAAMEAAYQTKQGAPLHLIAFPRNLGDILDPRAENLVSVSIPYMASMLASMGDPNAVVYGLEEFDVESPPVAVVFWSFRTMVTLGFWFILLGVWGVYRLRKGRLATRSRHLQLLWLSTPLGFVAIVVGWYVTEVGRQPWTIQDLLKTDAAVSPSVTGIEAALSLGGFITLYLLLLAGFLAGCKWLVDEELERIDEATAGAVSEPDVTPDPTEPVPDSGGDGP
ncbi:cytochrome ubiquinol oxidase subunit I [Haloparvum alkalitolerans]|uniref:cytochrome ubiquinol oxidase subunit I n=2 Tax=Haloparvum TaxID=1820337 RepID=UPI003CF7AB7D